MSKPKKLVRWAIYHRIEGEEWPGDPVDGPWLNETVALRALRRWHRGGLFDEEYRLVRETLEEVADD